MTHFLFALRCFDENNIGAGVGGHLGSAQGVVQAVHRPRVGARDNQEIVAFAAFRGDLDFLPPIMDVDHPLVRRMATFLGVFLILDLDRSGAGALVAFDRVGDVQQPAIPGVAIGDQGRADGFGQHLHPADHIGVRGQPRVGQAKGRANRAIAGHVQNIKAKLFGQARRNAVENARRDDQFAGRQQRFKGGHGSVSRGLFLVEAIGDMVGDGQR